MVARPRWRASRLWLSEFLRFTSTEPDALTFFASSDDWLLRQSVALNLSTSLELIERLSLDEDARVVDGVATNPRTANHLLWTIAENAAITGGSRQRWQAIQARAEADMFEAGENDPVGDLSWVIAQDARCALQRKEYLAR